MTRATLTFQTLLFLTGAAAAAAGCATARAGVAHDVHASTNLDGREPRVLVDGPAVLMHVDVEGRGELSLYTVARAPGTEADCATGRPTHEMRVRGGAPNQVNLAVGANESICITEGAPGTASLPPAPRVAVMWHVRRSKDATPLGDFADIREGLALASP